MIAKIMNNWHWKLLSIFIAFIFWVVIVNVQDPVVKKTFVDIPVERRNEQSITSKNLAVEYKEGDTVTVVLRAKRTIIDNLSSDDIIAFADLDKVSITNAIDITIDVDDEIEVIKKTPTKMVIDTEPINNMLKSVQVFYNGELETDYIKLKSIVTPNVVEMTGPASKLARVASVVVQVDIDKADDDVLGFFTPQLLDVEGNEVDGIEVNHNQIQIRVPIQKIKTIPIVYQYQGTIAENYRLISKVEKAKSVTVRGEVEDLVNVSRLIINDIDLSNLTDQDTMIELNLTRYLPEGVELYEDAALQQIILDIEPIIPHTLEIMQDDLNVRQLPEGLQFKFINEEIYTIEILGIYPDISELTIQDFLPSISLADLEVGIHEVVITLAIPDKYELTSELPIVTIELVQAEVIVDGTETQNNGGSNPPGQ